MLSFQSFSIEDENQAEILVYHRGVPTSNTVFDFYFLTSNLLKQSVTGRIKNVDGLDVVVMEGSYQYKGPDNVLYRVNWSADEKGFYPISKVMM